MSAGLRHWRERIRQGCLRLRWLPLLLVRICLGGLFLSTGWGKVHHIAKVTAFFTELHIPAPAFNATLVGYSELICGALLLVGLFTRLASIPVLVTMFVALATAKAGEIHGWSDLFGQIEFTYLCMLVVTLVFGAGAVSIDGAVARARDASRGRRERDSDHAYAR